MVTVCSVRITQNTPVHCLGEMKNLFFTLNHMAGHVYSKQRPSKCRNANSVVTVEFYGRTVFLSLILSLNRLKIFQRI
jgi:hypothetical protein